MEQKKIRILLVEDYDLVVNGLKSLFEKHPHITLEANVKSKEEAVAFLEENVDIDLVLMDLFLGRDGDTPEGLEASRLIMEQINRNSRKKVSILIVTGEIKGKWIYKAYNMGVRGYFDKAENNSTLIRAIERVYKGYKYYEDKVRELYDDYHDIKSTSISLTKAETDIADLIQRGKSRELIAKNRDSALGTIDVHLGNIFRKLGAENAAHMVALAKDMGLIGRIID